ncbi:hypothetical protein H4217_004806 [Coemansia sp. RSA 1939]|nr:hypothetical protein H4217_004806 [Coemansia sp. RSA 1939]KAJ2608508.1 hypothetical protein EV177_004939 [Coemansia sp. RSA 1804]
MSETGLWRIVRFLQREGYNSGVALDKEQLSQTTAYVSMVQDSLVDAILYMWYLVPENFVQVIRPRLAKMFGLPLSLAMPTHLKDCAINRLAANGLLDAETFASATGGGHDDDDPTRGGFLKNRFLQLRQLAKEGFRKHANTTESVDAALARHPVLAQADQYLLCLSQKLGERDFFFGRDPSLLDAVVYGHLSLVLRVDLPHNPLRKLVTASYINLAEHCARMHARLRPPAIASQQSFVSGLGSYLKQAVPEHVSIPDALVPDIGNGPEYVANLRAIAGALCIFAGYIIYNGVLQTTPHTPNTKAEELDDTLLESVSVGNILNAIK